MSSLIYFFSFVMWCSVSPPEICVKWILYIVSSWYSFWPLNEGKEGVGQDEAFMRVGGVGAIL